MRIRHGLMAMTALAASLSATAALAQASPWFGLPAPGPATEQTGMFDDPTFKQLPAPPVGRDTEFDGGRLYAELNLFVGFSYISRDAGDRVWGRIAGNAASEASIDYVLAQLKAAGLVDLAKVPVPFDGPQPLPRDWSLEILGTSETGNAGQSVPLRSGVPRGATADEAPLSAERQRIIDAHPTRSATAPLVYAGDGSPAAIGPLDLKGKIAVVHIPANPAPYYNSGFYAAPMGAIKAGAVGVIAVVEGPGNMLIHGGDCFPQLCFNVGSEDGAFLDALLARAAANGMAGQIRARLSVTETIDPTRISHFVIGRVKGSDPRTHENIVINAHSDGWFAAADDNGTGVVGLLALARHYAKPRNRPRHDIYFVLSAGHHSPTANTRPLVDHDRTIAERNIVMVNLEHISSIGVVRSAYGSMMRPPPRDRYGNIVYPYYPTNWDTQLRSVTMRPDSPVLKQAWEQAARRNAMSSAAFVVGPASGETRPFTLAGGAAINNVEANIWYHTSGDTVKTVAPEGMQRALLFFRDFVDTMDRHSRADVQPPGQKLADPAPRF